MHVDVCCARPTTLPPGIPAQVGNRATDASSYGRRQVPAAPALLALPSLPHQQFENTHWRLVSHSPLHVETRAMSTSFKSSIFMVLAAVTANISSVSGKRNQKRSKHSLLERKYMRELCVMPRLTMRQAEHLRQRRLFLLPSPLRRPRQGVLLRRRQIPGRIVLLHSN